MIEEVEQQLQHPDERHRAKSADGVHDLLLRVGDLSRDEVRARCESGRFPSRERLMTERRAVEVRVAGEARLVAVEDAVRYRDALGVPLPHGLPEALLDPVADAAGDLVLRFARTHGPFTTEAVASRFGLPPRSVAATLLRLRRAGGCCRVRSARAGAAAEWCENEVLRLIRQRSLARLRRQVEPVSAAALGRLTATWHGLPTRRRGPDALLDVVEQLQGAPIVASLLEREILPARIDGTARPTSTRCAARVRCLGRRRAARRADGRVALYLTDHLPRLLPARGPAPNSTSGAAILAHLEGKALRSSPPSTTRAAAGTRRNGGSALGPGLARPGHERRPVPRAAGLHAAADDAAAAGHGTTTAFRSRRLTPPRPKGERAGAGGPTAPRRGAPPSGPRRSPRSC